MNCLAGIVFSVQGDMQALQGFLPVFGVHRSLRVSASLFRLLSVSSIASLFAAAQGRK